MSYCPILFKRTIEIIDSLKIPIESIIYERFKRVEKESSNVYNAIIAEDVLRNLIIGTISRCSKRIQRWIDGYYNEWSSQTSLR